jgi:hypothetical protein
MALGTARSEAPRTDESRLITIVATHVTTDELHVVTGSEAEVLADFKRRFPLCGASRDLAEMLEAVGRTHCIARFTGRVRVARAS